MVNIKVIALLEIYESEIEFLTKRVHLVVCTESISM